MHSFMKNPFLGERDGTERLRFDHLLFCPAVISVRPPVGGQAEATLVLNVTKAHLASCLVFMYVGGCHLTVTSVTSTVITTLGRLLQTFSNIKSSLKIFRIQIQICICRFLSGPSLETSHLFLSLF